MSCGAGFPSGVRVVVAGATSESGVAVCSALLAAGAQVVAIGSSAERLEALTARVPGARMAVCDLADSEAVDALAAELSGSGGVDGLVHLVGGWVGGRGIVGQTDQAWDSMERSFRTLRNTTRAFYPALLASPAGRACFVSSTSVDSPTASGASYTAAKAAAESWMRSLAAGFGADSLIDGEPTAAATVFVVRALVDDRMRAAAPDRGFAGFTEVGSLADAVCDLWGGPAARLNGTRIRL